MSTRVLFAAICAVAIALPVAPAHATLAFERDGQIFVGRDDGAHAHATATGMRPRVSPDGRSVAFVRYGRPLSRGEVLVVPASGGAPRQLRRGLASDVVWSPDGRRLVAAVYQGVDLVDVGSARSRKLVRTVDACDYVAGMSFRPDGGAVAVACGLLDYVKIRVVYLRRGGQRLLASSPYSDYGPVWGRRGVAFSYSEATRYEAAPTFPFLGAVGEPARPLADMPANPVAWFPDGDRLLVQDAKGRAAIVNPDGQLRLLAGQYRSVRQLSKDGSAALAETEHDVFAVPTDGSPARLLIRNGSNASWSR